MCGIVGLAGSRNDELLRRMAGVIRHRGPDDSGFHFGDSLSLGMCRLSVLDLSGGHQPMLADDGRVVLVYNGELYNHAELREELTGKGHAFRTRSDTEVLLRGYLEWGVAVVDRLEGMFAFAVADLRGEPVLHLVRDRFGVKPLYYRLDGGRLAFGSEIKAILADGAVSRRICPRALDHYLRLRYVPGDRTMFAGILKLPAGCRMTWRGGVARMERYWRVTFGGRQSRETFEDATERVGELLRRSVRRRLVADVPVGAFLSGGVDSGLIVALMREQHGGQLDTFSVGFKSTKDELSDAAETARLLGTRHHEVVCTDGDMGLVDELAWHLDEPIGDAIVVPMYLLAREARRHVTVVLAGEGADEVFGGYLFSKALVAADVYRRRVPARVRGVLHWLFDRTPHSVVNRFFEYPASLGAAGQRTISGFLGGLDDGSALQQFRRLISLYSGEELDAVYEPGFRERLDREAGYGDDETVGTCADPVDAMLALLYRDWLPDDILMKLDKLTMANSLEGREPFLDRELVEYVNGLPGEYKIRWWSDKRVLRAAAGRLLPVSCAQRKKKPFYMPIDEFFGRPTFAALFERLRGDSALRGVVRDEYVRGLDRGDKSVLGSKRIFAMVMLDAWFRRFGAVL